MPSPFTKTSSTLCKIADSMPAIANRLLKWQHGQSAGPWKLKIFPTYRCNISCGICVRHYSQESPALLNELPDERWLSLLDEAAALGTRCLTIGGGGEPTLRGNLIRLLCIKAKEHQMEGFLQTNGTRMTPELIDTLVGIAWDFVTISVDGPNRDINDAIRCKGVYDSVVEALLRIKKAKETSRSTRPFVSVHMIPTAVNYRHLPQMVEFCKNHGVDGLAISPLLETGMENSGYLLNPQQRLELPAVIQDTISAAKAANLTLTLHALSETPEEPSRIPPDAEISPASWQGHLVGVKCLEPWNGLTVFSGGQMSPCCYFWEEQADNIRDKSLDEIWHGAYLSSIRECMLSGQMPSYCVNCYYPETGEHRACKRYLRDLALFRDRVPSGMLGFPMKVWCSMRTHGLKGALRRFCEWRIISRKMRRDS